MNEQKAPEELYPLFTSSHFIRSLRKSGFCTYQTGHETGFTVDKDHTGRLFVGKVAEGLCDQIVYGLDKLDFDATEDISPETAKYLLGQFSKKSPEKKERILWFHFHPLVNQPIIPSGKDLEIITKKEMAGIGKISNDKKIEVLLFQQKSKYLLSDSSLERLNAECGTTLNVAEFLERSGLYNSAVINYEFVKNRDHRTSAYIPAFSRDDFSRFLFV